MTTAPELRSVSMLTLTMAVLTVLGLSCSTETTPQNKPTTPRLVVLMVVDQMRADYLTRWQGEYDDGLYRLRSEGAVFTQAYHDHAASITAVGHATLATGCFPSKNGIVGNSFWDRADRSEVKAVEDDSTSLVGGSQGFGSSPQELLHTTVCDWLKRASPDSRRFAVSLKDRAAVLPGGMSPDGAFWYDTKTGNLVTSTYYTQTLPAWVEAFNRSGAKNLWWDSSWEKSRSDLPYQGVDSCPNENDGRRVTFPHTVVANPRSDSGAYYDAIWDTPFGDALLLQFAAALIRNERMGADSIPDLLCLSLSSADAVGHLYGPDSWEIEDYYLRLDEQLGGFLDLLDSTVGSGKYVLILAGDHAVSPFPELENGRGNLEARRVLSAEYDQDVAAALGRAFPDCPHPESLLFAVPGGYAIDATRARQCGLDSVTLLDRAANEIERVDYVAEVFTYSQLLTDANDSRPITRLFRNSFHPERSPDLIVNLKEWLLVESGPCGTTHGSPYSYDRHVPLVVYGDGIPAGVHDDTVRTVDVAPTIANILGVTPPSDLDGRALEITTP